MQKLLHCTGIFIVFCERLAEIVKNIWRTGGSICCLWLLIVVDIYMPISSSIGDRSATEDNGLFFADGGITKFVTLGFRLFDAICCEETAELYTWSGQRMGNTRLVLLRFHWLILYSFCNTRCLVISDEKFVTSNYEFPFLARIS